jgi:DNA-binding transcriptional LysR family regulator
MMLEETNYYPILKLVLINPHLIEHKPLMHDACETAHVSAVREVALGGSGVAWLPRSVCTSDIDSWALVILDTLLGSSRMNVVATRVATPHTRLAENTWSSLATFFLGSRRQL